MPLMRAPPIIVSAQDSKPKSSIKPSIKVRISSRDMVPGNRNCAENSRASRGVAVASNESSCITYAMRSRNSTGLMRWPATVIVPVISVLAADADRPASTLRMLDLPAPEGPMMAQTVPAGTGRK